MQLSSKLMFSGTVALAASFIFSVASAIPLSDFTWTEPTNYENGQVIDPITDVITYSVFCSSTSGGPYTLVANGLTGSAANNLDVGSCINNTPGTYYFVATATSSFYNSESIFSNEASKTYTVTDLGQVPNPPVLISVQ
jgi:hypothetical protein